MGLLVLNSIPEALFQNLQKISDIYCQTNKNTFSWNNVVKGIHSTVSDFVHCMVELDWKQIVIYNEFSILRNTVKIWSKSRLKENTDYDSLLNNEHQSMYCHNFAY